MQYCFIFLDRLFATMILVGASSSYSSTQGGVSRKCIIFFMRTGHMKKYAHFLFLADYCWLFADAGASQNQASFNNRDFPIEGGKLNLLPSPLSIGVLQEIARRCSSKVLLKLHMVFCFLLFWCSDLFVEFEISFCTFQVEFKSVLSTSKDLQFSVEVCNCAFCFLYSRISICLVLTT